MVRDSIKNRVRVMVRLGLMDRVNVIDNVRFALGLWLLLISVLWLG